MEMMIIPTDTGCMKMFIYGFKEPSSKGKIITEYNEHVAIAKGYNFKDTMLRSLAKLNKTITNNKLD